MLNFLLEAAELEKITTSSMENIIDPSSMRRNPKYITVDVDQLKDKNHYLLDYNTGRNTADSTNSDHIESVVMVTVSKENGEPFYDTVDETVTDNTQERPYYENVGLHTRKTSQISLTKSTEHLLIESPKRTTPRYENVGHSKTKAKNTPNADHSYANCTITPTGSMEQLSQRSYVNCTITPTGSLDNLTERSYVNYTITPTTSLEQLSQRSYANCTITPARSLGNLTESSYANCTITPARSMGNLTERSYANYTITPVGSIDKLNLNNTQNNEEHKSNGKASPSLELTKTNNNNKMNQLL